MSMTPAEMNFIAGKHAAAREIASALGAPRRLLGHRYPGVRIAAGFLTDEERWWMAGVGA